MTYRGTIRDGVVVLDSSVRLPEGVRVNVEPIEDAPLATFHPVPPWEGPEGEIEELLRQVQELRDADMNEGHNGSLSA